MSALRTLGALGYLKDSEPVDTSRSGKEHHRGVHRRRVDVLDKVLVTTIGTLDADTATRLRTELREGCTLDIS